MSICNSRIRIERSAIDRATRSLSVRIHLQGPRAVPPLYGRVPGKASRDRCRRARVQVLRAIRIAELDPRLPRWHTTPAALIGPDGYIGKYRNVGPNPSRRPAGTSPGNAGHPVFADAARQHLDGIRCYDTPIASRGARSGPGADMVAYVCSSDRVLDGGLALEANGEPFDDHGGQHIFHVERAGHGRRGPQQRRDQSDRGCQRQHTEDALPSGRRQGERTAHSPATTENTNSCKSRFNPLRRRSIQPCLTIVRRSTLRRRQTRSLGDLAFYRAPVDNVSDEDKRSGRSWLALQYRADQWRRPTITSSRVC